MEEKKIEMKISLLKTLLFIAVIVIIIMGITIYNLKTTELQKPIEPQAQTSSSNETVSDLQTNSDLDSNESALSNSSADSKKTNNTGSIATTEVRNSNTSSSKTEEIQSKERDYKDFIGTWENSETLNEITIKNVTNNSITFTWFLYRLAGIDDDTTLNFTNGKATFYFEGYDDKNFDSIHSEDEKYIRKATIKLDENGVSVNVEEVEALDPNYPVLEPAGFVYVKEGIYTHPSKIK